MDTQQEHKADEPQVFIQANRTDYLSTPEHWGTQTWLDWRGTDVSLFRFTGPHDDHQRVTGEGDHDAKNRTGSFRPASVVQKLLAQRPLPSIAAQSRNDWFGSRPCQNSGIGGFAVV